MATTAMARRRPGTPGGFDFTRRIRAVCADMVSRLPELQHIDLERVAVSFAQTRTRSLFGRHATLTPLRFEGGALCTVRRGRQYRIERVYREDGVEVLYILTFYLPRFLDAELEEKLTTILHELWHISPDFDGDLRRHPGRCYAHTHSQKEYDAAMSQLAFRWLQSEPPEPLYAFLRDNFQQLRDRYHSVHGMKIRSPKLVPV
jgi:hypothetical protein